MKTQPKSTTVTAASGSFEELLNEANRMFDIEKNIKNNLYAFILSMGLFEELKEYSQTHDMSSPDGHKGAVASLELIDHSDTTLKN